MSLISPKNFIAPFKNVVNLATIIVIALLFAIYRLSGGGVAMSNRKAVSPPSVRENSIKPSPLAVKESSPSNRKSLIDDSVPNQIDSNQSTLDDLLDEKPLKKPNKPSQANPSGSSLDDIAKQLGVE